jgi:hypothetical protein
LAIRNECQNAADGSTLNHDRTILCLALKTEKTPAGPAFRADLAPEIGACTRPCGAALILSVPPVAVSAEKNRVAS